MAWYNSIDKVVKSVGDYTGISGLIHDISTAGSNSDPWYVDAVNVTKDALKFTTTPLRLAVKGLFAAGNWSYETGGKGRRWINEQLLDTSFMYNKFKNSNESFDEYHKRVIASKEDISIGQSLLSVLSPGKNVKSNGWFQDWTENNAKFLSSGFDLFNEEDRKTAFSEQFLGHYTSGNLDFGASTIIDPLFFAGFAGKGASIAAKAPMASSMLGAGSTGIARLPGSLTRTAFRGLAMSPEKIGNLLTDAVAGKGRAVSDIQFLARSEAKEQYGYWVGKNVTHPDAMALLFGKADTEQKVIDTYRAVMGLDKKAQIALVEEHGDEVALILDKMNETSKPLRVALEGKLEHGDVITNPEYNNAVGGYLENLMKEDPRFKLALEQVSTGGNEFRGGTFARGPKFVQEAAQRKANRFASDYSEPSVTWFQKTGLHPTVGVFQFFTRELPSGKINVNDSNSFLEVNAFIRSAINLSGGTFRASAAGHADRYLNAPSPQAKNNIIKEMEMDALSHIAPNYTPEEIKKLYSIFDTRRANLIKEHNNRGFLSIMGHNGPFIAKIPVLERETANITMVMDLRKIKNGIDAHEKILPSLLSGMDTVDLGMRGEKFMNNLDTINDIFKTSVLLRLGYTARNLGEAQISMLAKGLALPAMVAAGGPAAVQRYFNNRQVGFSRMTDKVMVMAGKKDDWSTLNTEIARIIDHIKSHDMAINEISKETSLRIEELLSGSNKIIDEYIARQAALGTPVTNREEAAAAVLPEEINRLRGVLAELDSINTFHGSPANSFNLDMGSPLATSTSSNDARRYAQGYTYHAAEQYAGTTGRPVSIRNVTPETLLAANEKLKADMISAAESGQVVEIRRGTTLREERVPGQEFKLEAELAENIIRWASEWGGLSIRMTDGFMPVDGYMVAKPPQFGKIIDKADWDNPDTGYEILYNYIVLHKNDLANGKNFLGVWDNSAVDGKVYLDVSEKIMSRKKAIKMGEDNNQKSIYDVIANDTIETGGTGLVEETGQYGGVAGYDQNDGRAVAGALQNDLVQTTPDERAYSAGRFEKISLEKLKKLTVKNLERSVFRVNNNVGSINNVQSYGRSLDLNKWSDMPIELREAAFGGRASNYNSWVRTKGWQDKESPIFNWMRENGYANFAISEGRGRGVTYIVLPESIGKPGKDAAVKSYVSKAYDEGQQAAQIGMEDNIPERVLNTPGERRAALRKQRKSNYLKRKAVSPYYDSESVTAMFNNGIEDAASFIGASRASLQIQLDDLLQRTNARSEQLAKTNVPPQRVGYGKLSVEAGGQTYTPNNAFNEASWFVGRTSAEESHNALLNVHETAHIVGAGARVMRPVQPNDPRYYEAWANVLNSHFRDQESGIMDPVVRYILDGKDDNFILRWLSKTDDGFKYADNTYGQIGNNLSATKLRSGELDEYVLQKISDVRNAVKIYIPDNETSLMLSAVVDTENGKPLTGSDVEDFLRNRFANKPELLHEINGLLIPGSKESVNNERLLDKGNRRVMRFLGSMPEDRFMRHPLVVAVYQSNVKTNLTLMAKAKDGERLTPAEINRAESAARQEARREVERTLFTIVRRTGASSSRVMRLMFPFYGAYENSIKRWSGIVSENPSVLGTAGRGLAQIVNGQLVVDRDGNRITDPREAAEGNLVVQVPEEFIKSLPGEWQKVVENAFSTITIPLKSLDVVTQGNIGNPGFGPYMVAPANIILKSRPEFEAAFKPFFPVGQPESTTDIFLPSALRRLKSMWSQDDQYVRQYNQMLRYEMYNYHQGLRTDVPSNSEIVEKTNKFYKLRILTAVAAPFAISPEMDFYQQQFKRFQVQYEDRGVAEAKFLEMYPDFFEATMSLSKNPGGLEASLDAVKNLRKFSNLMAIADAKGQPEMMGFLSDDGNGKYDFSSAAYKWQYTHGAVPGAASNYRQNRNPQDLIRDSNVKQGWVEYRKMQDVIDGFKIQSGITSNTSPLLSEYNDAKKAFLNYQRENNKDWYSDFVSVDSGKYIQRSEILKKAFSDRAWMKQNGERNVVKSAILYLDARDKVSNMLLARAASGGSRVLSAESNSDISDMWSKFVIGLSAESTEFSDFYNRYFTNDPVVV